jgi:hypothetical protein
MVAVAPRVSVVAGKLVTPVEPTAIPAVTVGGAGAARCRRPR